MLDVFIYIFNVSISTLIIYSLVSDKHNDQSLGHHHTKRKEIKNNTNFINSSTPHYLLPVLQIFEAHRIIKSVNISLKQIHIL